MAVFLFVIAFLMVLLAIGTLQPDIPVLSSAANTITVTGAHLYLLVQLAVLGLASWMDLGLPVGCQWCLIGLIAMAVICELVILHRMVHTVRAAGVPIRWWRAYWPRIIRGVHKQTITYGTLPNSLLNVYYCDDGRTNKPVIIYTHGGGWFYGSKEDRTYYHQHFAKDGYVVVSIDYALSDADHHYAGATEAQLLEGLAWVLTNISAFNASVEGWAFAGDSAGGNLALNLAFKINAGHYTQADGTAFPAVSAVSVTYPVADPAGFYHNPDLIMGPVSRYSAKSYTGGTPTTHPEVYAAITPNRFLSAHTPPVCMVMGNQDAAVPPAGALALIDHINNLGILTKLINIPYANHACDTFWGSIASEAYIGATRQWFSAHRPASPAPLPAAESPTEATPQAA